VLSGTLNTIQYDIGVISDSRLFDACIMA